MEKIQFGQDSIDHILAIARGGDNSLGNLAIAHRSCNCEKKDKTVEEYKKWKKEYHG